MITEEEAIQTALALGTAMMHNDNDARELIYADLDADSLKRVLRWQTRFNLRHTAVIAHHMGISLEQLWQKLCESFTLGQLGE